MRCHEAFQELELSPFEDGYAIVDADTVERVRQDARRKRKRGMVMLSSATDAWSPEARHYDIGRGCLKAVLQEPDWTLRVLTKNAAVREDFDILKRHAGRVLVGLSTTFLPLDEPAASAVEPHASSPAERLRVLRRARIEGLRTYGMLCPLIPPFFNTLSKVESAFRSLLPIEPEEIFVEPLNPRGRGLIRTSRRLREAGLCRKAEEVNRLRSQSAWSRESRKLIERVIEAADRLYERDRLRVLVYGSSFTDRDRKALKQIGSGLVWL